jgi:hypothetical protein
MSRPQSDGDGNLRRTLLDRETGRLVQNATNDLGKQVALPLGEPNLALSPGKGAKMR